MINLNRPIGFGTGFYYFTSPEMSFHERVKRYKDAGCTAVEISIVNTKYLEENYNQEFIDLIKSFPYRSIHLPSKIDYPGPEIEANKRQIIDLANNINVSTILVHPPHIKDYGWLKENFGHLPLAIENMDWRANSGGVVKDLEKVFKELPKAKWVFDIQHVYTRDKSMKLAKKLFDAFSDRMAHYHLSGFTNPEVLHDCLSASHEDIIFKGIQEDKAPIILESVRHDTTITLNQELDYIKSHL